MLNATEASKSQRLPPSKIKHYVEDSILTGDPNTDIWEILEPIWIDGKQKNITLMADTGATICAVNADYARKYYRDKIRKCRPLDCRIVGKNVIQLKECIDLTFIDSKTQRPVTEIEFYLIEGLMYNHLASLYLIRKLNWKFIKMKPFEHQSEPDETFGTCHNWDPGGYIKPYINNEKQHISNIPHPLTDTSHIPNDANINFLTPYDYKLHKCNTPQPYLHQIPSVHNINTSRSNQISSRHINHISNFKATDEEIETARKLAQDKKYGRVDLEHLKERSLYLYEKMRYLCDVKYKNVWAKHQFHRRTIRGFEFKIDLKEQYIGQRIHKAQYHLNEKKRSLILYHTMKNIENGLFEPNFGSIHNTPMIIVAKKDGRLRPAYDFRKLNDCTKDVKSVIPSYHYLFELLRGRGLYTVGDLKNFFENIKIRESDRDLATITTPLGRFHLTHATYGFKNIATYAQQVSNALVQNMGRSGAFLDDVFIKHPENATDDELLAAAEKFLQRASDMNVLLHPEKTKFFVKRVEFLGYIFDQLGHRPQQSYIQKVLDFEEPGNNIKKIRAFIGLIQYIANYVHKLHEFTPLLTRLIRKDNNEKWGKVHSAAFKEIKRRVQNIKMLYHPTDNGEFLLQTDASKHSIGAVLYQRQYDPEINDYQWKIIEFFSKQIDPSLAKHPIMVRECLAIVYACNHWKHFLLRKKFYIDTDHKNLIALFDPDDNKAANMSKKQIFNTLRNAISMFHFELAHLPGADLVFADWLSRDGSKYHNIDKNMNNNSTLHNIIHNITNMYNVTRATELQSPHLKLMTKPLNPIEQAKYSDTLNKIKSTRETLQYNLHHGYNYEHSICQLHTISNLKHKTDTYNDIISTNELVNFDKFINHLNIHYIRSHGYILHNNNDNIDQSHIMHIQHNIPTQNTTEIHCHSTDKCCNQTNQFHSNIANVRQAINCILNNNTSHISPQLFKHINTILDKSNIKLGENYHTDINQNRRSKRARKQVKQYWEQDIFKDKTVDLLKENIDFDNIIESVDTDNDTDDEDEHIESENDATNVTIPTDTHQIAFPYSVTTNLLESFYDRLHTPNEHTQLLTNENLKKYQRSDHVYRYLIRYILRKDTRAAKYLKTNYNTIFRNANNHLYFIDKNGILLMRNLDKNLPSRICIPTRLIHAVLEFEHKVNHISHPGTVSMIRTLSSKFYWYRMNHDIRTYVKICETCQLGKGSKKRKVGTLAPLTASERGELVHFDFAGPFYNRLNLLIMVDHYTGQVVLHPCKTQSAESVAHALVHVWYRRHGLPKKILTDRGAGFIARANKIVCKSLGIHNVFTSAYHPQTNAKAERVVQEVKKALCMANITLDYDFTYKNKFDERDINRLIKEITLLLPSIEFSINQKVHTVTQVSPNMLMYGRNLRDIVDFKLARNELDKLPSDFDNKAKLNVVEQIKNMIRLAENKHNINHQKYVIYMKEQYDIDKYDETYKIGDLVAYYIGDVDVGNKKKLQRKFSGPFKVTKIVNHNTVEIEKLRQPGSIVQIENKITGDKFACHTSMLKLYHRDHFIPFSTIKQSKLASQERKEKDRKQKLRRSSRLRKQKQKKQS